MQDGRILVVVGDVVGQSILGAMLMAMMRVALRSETSNHTDLALIMGDTNRALLTNMDHKIKATLLLLAVDPQTPQLTFVNAGHPHPLRLRGTTVEEIISEGTQPDFGGSASGQDYLSTTIELRTGDLIIAYTDGLVNTRGPEGRAYGKEGLFKTLRSCANLNSDQAREKILADLTTFRGKTIPQEDVTIMLISLDRTLGT